MSFRGKDFWLSCLLGVSLALVVGVGAGSFYAFFGPPPVAVASPPPSSGNVDIAASIQKMGEDYKKLSDDYVALAEKYKTLVIEHMECMKVEIAIMQRMKKGK